MRYRYRTDNEMKDSGVEWLGRIPREWERTKIKYHTTSLNGYAFKSDLYLDNNDGIPVIRIGDIKDNIDFDMIKRVVSKEEYEPYTINKNDILIALTGATIGKTALYNSEKKAYLNQRVGVFRGKTIDNKFLYYGITSDMMKEYIRLQCDGSAQENIGNNEIGIFNISYPKIQEQQKIASFLDKKTAEFDTIINKKQSLITKLTEAKKSLISEVVTGKKKLTIDNGQWTMRDRADDEMKDSGNIFYKKIPKQWIISKFKHISNQIIDGSHFTPTYVSEGVPFLRVTDITKGQLKDINMNEVMFIPEEEHKELIKRCKPEKGDLLVSKNGTIGIPKVIDWDWEFSIFVSLCLIKLKEKTNPYLLSYYFKSGLFDNQIAYSGKTTSITNLHLDKIREFFIIIQSNQEQQLIVDFLDEKTAKIDSTIEKINLQIEKLKEAKQSLISEAVTGKIEVLD